MDVVTSFSSTEIEMDISDGAHHDLEISGRIINGEDSLELGFIIARRTCIRGLNFVNIADYMDSQGADEFNIFTSIANDTSSLTFAGQIEEELIFGIDYIMFINDIYINPSYRGKGLGEFVINSLMRTFCYNTTLTCLHAKPSQLVESKVEDKNTDYSQFSKSKAEAFLSLNKYYKSIGFKKIQSSEDGDIFYKTIHLETSDI